MATDADGADAIVIDDGLMAMLTLAREGMMMIVAADENGIAAAVADVRLLLDHGRGRAHGPPESILRNRQHERTRDFLQRVPHPTP